MAHLLGQLAQKYTVSVISGGDWPQYLKQLVPELINCNIDLKNFIFCPTCATKMYTYNSNGSWDNVYSLSLSDADKEEIQAALDIAVVMAGYKPESTWGPQLEDRGTQITFSALGQDAPLVEKSKWDPDFIKRKAIKKELDRLIPNFSVRLGGTTSIDITAKGVDKAYGLNQICQYLRINNLRINMSDILFVGDAIFPDGNDYPVVTTGCDYICVESVDDTIRVIQNLIK